MTVVSGAIRESRASDYYLILLSVMLMGYAVIGKGVAYLGFPPFYVGELALLAGMTIVVSRMGCLVAALATLPSLLLATMMAWVLLRTLPYVGEYGFDALRDSVVVMYSGFAFIIIALLLDDCRRVHTLVRYYGTFANIFVWAIPFILALNVPTDETTPFRDYIPKIPGYDVPVIDVRSGEAATHLAGACVFALAGFRKVTARWIIPVVITALLLTRGRGAMLSFGLPVLFAMLVLGKSRALARILTAAVVIFSVSYAVETPFIDDRVASLERGFSTRQITESIASIFSSSEDSPEQAELEGTKQWRLQWWDIILADTVYGPHFWTGRGFGLNLADADGFQVIRSPNSPPLRSPHSAHMTILARAGVPGLTLWIAFIVSWFGMVMHAMLNARCRGQTEWAGLFLFVCCYVMAIIIDISFDVALEGPMTGIWFWCLVGFGIAATMVYRAGPGRSAIRHP